MQHELCKCGLASKHQLIAKPGIFEYNIFNARQSFPDAVYNKAYSICSCICKIELKDKIALLYITGLPNNKNNNNWRFK